MFLRSRQPFPIQSCPPRVPWQSCAACRLKTCPGEGAAVSLSLMTKDKIKIEDDPWLNITEFSQLTVRKAQAMGWLAALLSYVMYWVMYKHLGVSFQVVPLLFLHVASVSPNPCGWRLWVPHRVQLITAPAQDFHERNGEHWNVHASSAGK